MAESRMPYYIGHMALVRKTGELCFNVLPVLGAKVERELKVNFACHVKCSCMHDILIELPN